MDWKSECEKEGYNGAYKGFSPFDMDADECRNWDEYDCCDDAEDYEEEGDDGSDEE